MRKLTTIVAISLFFVGMIFVSMNTGSDSQPELVFLAGSAPTISGSASTFFPCARNYKDSQWTYSSGYSTIKCESDTYLAYGQGGVVTSPAFQVGTHQGLILSFKLAFIDSWDGETFSVKADGQTIYSQAWTFGKSTSNTCQSEWNDAYTTVKVALNHTASTVTFVFSSTLDQTSEDEAWGICDLKVTSVQDPVKANGDRIPTIGSGARTWFPCRANTQDNTWTYSQGYRTIKCGADTYLAYGQGGVVTSPRFNIGTHKGLIVSFKLAFIDSWDAEYFYLKVDGIWVYESFWIYSLSSSNSCQSSDWNDAYTTATVGVNHTASSVSFSLASTLDQGSDDEAWGVCDFTVTASQFPVTADGTPITA